MPLNTEEFLSMSTDEQLDTVVIPCPEGEHTAMIGDIEIKDFTFKSGDREGQTGYRLVVPMSIEEDSVKEKLGRDSVRVTQSIMLDVSEDGNGLDFSKGKNIGLGRLREALGQNKAGQPWSPAMLNGQILKVQINHDIYNGNVVAQVTGVRSA